MMASRLRSSLLGRQGAQRVVAAELDDDVARLVAEHPVEAREAAGRGVARDARVEHLAVIAFARAARSSSCAGKPCGQRPARSWRSGNRRAPRSGRLPSAAAGAGVRGATARTALRSRDHCRPCSAPSSRNSARPSLRMEPPMIELADVHVTLSSAAGPVHILRGVDLSVRGGQLGRAWSAPRAPASRPCSRWSAASSGRPPGACGSTARTSARSTRTGLAAFRGQKIGILFQAFHLIPTMTALENVAVPLELARERDAHRQARRAARGGRALGDRAGHYPGQLSGGEQQRTALARALANHPKLLLADEPTGNLDQETGREIVELVSGCSASAP